MFMLPFQIIGVLIAAVVAILTIRKARRRREERMLMALTLAREANRERFKRPSDAYHDQVWLPLCELIGKHAYRVGHRLTCEERRRIWRSRTSLILEALLREIENAKTAEPIVKALAELPPGLDRPDPTGWCAEQN